MTTRFRDFYGGTASIKTGASGATLTVRTSGGKLTHKKTYATERGAKIAMGRISEGWRKV